MQFPFLLLVCKFTCSQNSSPERLLLCLKCKVCTPTCQLRELAVAIMNSSEGQQTFAIKGDWINSGICKTQIVVSLPEKCIHLICTTSLPSIFSEMLQDPSNMNSSSKHHLSYPLMRIQHVLLFIYIFMSIMCLIHHMTETGVRNSSQETRTCSTPTCKTFSTQPLDGLMHALGERKLWSTCTLLLTWREKGTKVLKKLLSSYPKSVHHFSSF